MGKRCPSASVRLRITLWNVLILACCMVALGFTVRWVVGARLYATVDQILLERARPTILHVKPPADGAKTQWVFGEEAPKPWTKALTAAPQEVLTLPLAFPAETRKGDILTYAGSDDLALLPRFVERSPADGGKGQSESPPPWDHVAAVRTFSGRDVRSTVVSEGRRLRVLSVPTWEKDRVVGAIQLAYPLEGVERELYRLTHTLLMLLPAGLVVAGVGGALITGRALAPVREMAALASEMGADELSRRLPVQGRDEFSHLARTFNGMLERLEGSFKRQRQFTADASHELRTPLSVVRATAGLALERPLTVEEYQRALIAIDRASERQQRLVSDLLFLARADAGRLARDLQPTSLLEVLEEACEPFQREGSPQLRIEELDPELMVEASGYELTRLFTNLVENAVRHTPPDGQVTLATHLNGPAVEVTVRDSGGGIPAEALPHLGERFFRVEAGRGRECGGSGLGLAISRSIVAAHGGTLTLESQVGKGTCVRVRLPVQYPPIVLAHKQEALPT